MRTNLPPAQQTTPPSRWPRVSAIALLFALVSGTIAGVAQVQPLREFIGDLASGDRTLQSGEYYDEHKFEGRAGDRVAFDLTSAAFDPYLIVVSPSGTRSSNDDWQQSRTRARVELTLTESGSYRLLVTSKAKDEIGAYELRVLPAAPAADSRSRAEAGTLGAGDPTLKTGEFFDEFSFEWRRGVPVVIELRSSDFDTYLIVRGPGNQRHDNDDFETDPRRSLVSFTPAEDGRYEVLVTSYEKGEVGKYDLRIEQQTANTTGPRVERGALASGDRTLQTKEYMDEYSFEGRPGQRVTLDVQSSAFDTYLILVPPRGDRHENDDVDAKPGHSVIDTELTELGTYRVIVTSYKKGEVGDYELSIDLQEEADASAPVSATGEKNTSGEYAAIALGQDRAGQLVASDRKLESGEYYDRYSFEAAAGSRVIIELASKEFDPYLVLIPPEGESIDNDDAEGRTDLSRIDQTVAAAGRYRVLVTSYRSGETGAYRLTLREEAAVSLPAPSATSGRVFGVFVGISKYGDDRQLQRTVDDARYLEQALLRNGDMMRAHSKFLADERATRQGLREAIQDVARQAGPDDTFLFFFSGHGDRVRRTAPQPADPDGFDEAIVLVDGQVTDDELSAWLAPIRSRVALIAIDACYSGGFLKDLGTVPGRIGFFSSEEDMESAEAAKFKAGGYLAHYLLEALEGRDADADGDGKITAPELQRYMRGRWDAAVQAGDSTKAMRSGGRATDYQELVIDRAGVTDVLFNTGVTQIDRYPVLDAPDQVAPGARFPVQFSLSDTQTTPQVQVRSGGSSTSPGALALPLPTGDAPWKIDVIVSAQGFDIEGDGMGSIQLKRTGDSSTARFFLTAKPAAGSPPRGMVSMTLWHQGAFLAKVAREIVVSPGQTQPSANPPDVPAAPPIILNVGAQKADLTIYENPDGTLTLSSTSFGTIRSPAPKFDPKWLESYFARFSQASPRGLEVPGAKPLTLVERVALMKGFGRDLYDKFAPEVFKQYFWKVRDARGTSFLSIEVHSANPRIPWELMRPSRGSDELDFLGIDFNIARQPVTTGTTPYARGPQKIDLRETVVIAPQYQGAMRLPSQPDEVQALSKVPGYRTAEPTVTGMAQLFGQLPEGIVHFSGHGVVQGINTAAVKYVMRLQDGDLDMVTWRGFTSARPAHRPFIFMNACDTGRAQQIANFVEGWAPRMLEGGASGYVGGLWPLGDRGAASFAKQFYERLTRGLQDGPVNIADVLRFTRKGFYETGDPTYLAYIYYGDPHFSIVSRK